MRHSVLLRPALLLAALALAGCATPIGVDRADPRRVQREISASALTGNEPSAPTLAFLTRMNLREPFARDPAGTLDAIHAELAPRGDMDRLFALAELSFLLAERSRDRDRALAAAVYAYAFLFDDASPLLDRFDPRVIVARHLYNRGLDARLRERRADAGDAGRGPPHAADGNDRRRHGAGRADLGQASSSTSFTSVADFRVRGLDNRYRQAGIGAPLAATLGAPVGPVLPSQQYIPPRLRVPTTAVLRIERPRAQLASGQLAGTLELFGEDDRQRELDDQRRRRAARTREDLLARLHARRRGDLGLRLPGLPARRLPPDVAGRAADVPASVPEGRDPAGARARDLLQPGDLGAAGQRARERPRGRQPLPALALHVQLGQSRSDGRPASSRRRCSASSRSSIRTARIPRCGRWSWSVTRRAAC